MKKNYFLPFIIIIIIGIFNSVKGQTNYTKQIAVTITLSGKVTAAGTGLPLASASIYIPDLRVGATADVNGNFSIHNIPEGNYLVQAGYVGYQSMVKKLSLSENTTSDFALEIAVTEESEIVITGSSKATTIRRNPIPIISISKQYLQQNLSTNIIDAIARVPGVSAVTTGPNVSKPFIRGLGFNRILTLYDGVRQEGQQWGDEHGIEV
nr:TonB-dependent receptor [Bacteroidota bacterium]